MIAVVAYGMGNVRSVMNAFDHLGVSARVAESPADMLTADKVIIPGVGAFRQAMARLSETGFKDALHEHAVARKKPVLGICLGMQLLATTGTEGGESHGLGWIPGRVVIIPRGPQNLRLPHVGWNEVAATKDCPLLAGLGADNVFYFVHSFYLRADDAGDVSGVTDYGGPITAAVSRDNVFGMQAHPEKSQKGGLKVLSNFAKL